MCGICGGVSDKKINLDNMVKAIHHRGPDNSGKFFYKNTQLAHTRLAIIDLSELGNQPMSSFCGNYVISYNGEIYNFHEIRDVLIGKGYFFKSKTDTEVVINSFVEWGVDCFKLFNGMFSLRCV